MFNSEKERLEHFYMACEGAEFELSKEFDKWLSDNGFFTAPASSKYHGAYEGGLFDHSYNVFTRLNVLTTYNNLKWQRKQSPFIIGMFHDLCKCDQYIKVPGILTGADDTNISAGFHYEYDKGTLLKGHGSKSIMLLSQFINLTEEELLCIRYHMGAYGNEQEQKDEWAGFDQAIRKTDGLCLYTHLADQLASKIDEA